MNLSNACHALEVAILAADEMRIAAERRAESPVELLRPGTLKALAQTLAFWHRKIEALIIIQYHEPIPEHVVNLQSIDNDNPANLPGHERAVAAVAVAAREMEVARRTYVRLAPSDAATIRDAASALERIARNLLAHLAPDVQDVQDECPDVCPVIDADEPQLVGR